MVAKRGVYSAIGLDLGSSRVKAVQLFGRPSSWSVHRAADFSRPRVERSGAGGFGGSDLIDPREVVAMGGVLGRMGFVGDRFAVSMPVGDTVQTVLSLPSTSDGGRLVKLASVELARLCRSEPGDLEAAAWPVGGGGGGREGGVMAVACRRVEAEGMVRAFERAGRELVAIDVAGSALARGACALVDRPALLVDLGHESARVVALSGGLPAYQRTLSELSVGALHRRAAERFGLTGAGFDALMGGVGEVGGGSVEGAGGGVAASAAGAVVAEWGEKLMEQVRASEHYASDALGVDASGRSLVCGGGSALRGVVGVLRERFGFAWGEADLAGVGGMGVGRGLSAGALVQALGLAVRFDGIGGVG